MHCGSAPQPAAERTEIVDVTDVMRVERSDFVHGLVECPKCRQPLDAHKDVDDLIQPASESTAIGARMTHRGCGSSFQMVFG